MNKYINLYKYVMIVLVTIYAGFLSSCATDETNKQLVFATPESAVEALKVALKDNNIPALLNLFGHQYKSEIDTSDKAAEKVRRNKFYKVISDGYRFEPIEPNKVAVLVGKNDWPFSIPLVKNDAGWYFDTEAGIEEIINRRIGHNELAAIAACDAILDAQVKYAKTDHDDDGVLEFAQAFKSKPGQRNGLYWESSKAAATTEKSPLEAFVQDAGDYLNSGGSTKDPYKGYFFKVISSQGENAVGGKYDYIFDKSMIAGFAVIAWPAEYANTGIMTFMVSHEGTILEKDLGENTVELVVNMRAFNPDKTWNPVQLAGK